MSVGAMGLLSAINAFMYAGVPAVWTATQGNGLGLVGWLGAAIGLTAMALVARKPGDEAILANHRLHALSVAAAGSLLGLGYIYVSPFPTQAQPSPHCSLCEYPPRSSAGRSLYSAASRCGSVGKAGSARTSPAFLAVLATVLLAVD